MYKGVNILLNESRINYKILNISFMKKDYIENYDSNYEQYLNEFINNSRFVTDNNNSFFVLNCTQSMGEPDSSNGFYELEFKLFIDEETLVNKSNYTESICIDSNGARIYGASKRQGVYQLVNLKSLLSKYTFETFNSLKNKNSLNKEEAKIKRFLEKLEIDKNIIFLIPYVYYYDSYNIGDQNVLEFLISKFSKEYQNSIKYRKQYTKKDTYIAFFIEDYIVFTKENESKLYFYDKVEINKSEKFIEIKSITDPFIF